MTEEATNRVGLYNDIVQTFEDAGCPLKGGETQEVSIALQKGEDRVQTPIADEESAVGGTVQQMKVTISLVGEELPLEKLREEQQKERRVRVVRALIKLIVELLFDEEECGASH